MVRAAREEGRKQRLWMSMATGLGKTVRDDFEKQLPEEVSPDRLDTPALERRRVRSCWGLAHASPSLAPPCTSLVYL